MSLESHDEGRGLLERLFVADAHFDLPLMVLARRRSGERRVIERRYLEGLRRGGVDLLVCSLFVPDAFLPEMALRHALDQVAALREEEAESPHALRLCRNVDDIEAAGASGCLAMILSFEGAEPLGNDLGLLRVFHDLGVRGLGLAWSRRNAAADGCHFHAIPEGRRGGLSAFGVALLAEARRLGCYLDVSHLNDEGFWDVLEHFDGPVMASHSNCRSLVSVPRNLTDEQIVALAGRQGLVGMNACSRFVASCDRPDIDALIDHVDHVVGLVDIDHVCLGLDLCDSIPAPDLSSSLDAFDVVDTHGALGSLASAMLRRGYGEGDIAAVFGGNLHRFLKGVLTS